MSNKDNQLTRRERKATENVVEVSKYDLGVWPLASDKDINLKDAYELLERLEKKGELETKAITRNGITLTYPVIPA
jgi:hypothetical protein